MKIELPVENIFKITLSGKKLVKPVQVLYILVGTHLRPAAGVQQDFILLHLF